MSFADVLAAGYYADAFWLCESTRLMILATPIATGIRSGGMSSVRPLLSVVTTLYRSEKFIGEFYRRISGVAEQITSDYEIVFVNDGSPDGSLSEALRIARQDAASTR